MFKLKFKLTEKSDHLIMLTLNNGFRYFFILLSLFLVYFTFTEGNTESSNLGPLIIIVISLVFSAYNEAWIFDKEAGTVMQKQGFIFISKNKSINIEDIETFQISHFMMGSRKMVTENKRKFFQSKYIKLSFYTLDGESHVIEILKSINKPDVEYKANKLAEFCTKPLENQDV